MNRYKTAPGLGPSKASASTICQKCLQKGHYSYECKGALQSRPYVSRASRTQQLRNPKLKPALAEVKLEEATKKTDETTVADALEDNKNTRRSHDEGDDRPTKRRRRSPSIDSVDSISTISTNASDDKPPEKIRQASISEPGSTTRPSRPSAGRRQRSPYSRSRSPPARTHSDRAARRRQDQSPRHDRRDYTSPERRPSSKKDSSQPASRRDRSLSPYSRRLALTQAMNMH